MNKYYLCNKEGEGENEREGERVNEIGREREQLKRLSSFSVSSELS